MKGTIRPKGNCPECGGKFELIEKLGFLCRPCKEKPSRLYIDLHWKGKRYRIFSDKQGLPIDSYSRAQKLQSHIQTEIDNHTFDPSKYVRAELEQFYAKNLLDRYYNDKIDSMAPSYKTDFKRYIERAKEFFKITDVRDIRKVHLIDYKKHLGKAYKLSGKSVKNIMDVFKAFLNYLKNDLELIDIVPAFPEIEFDTPAFKWLHPEDQIKLFEFVPAKHKPIIAFLMLHGCRPSEARALKIKNVDLKSQTITISATFSGNVYREKRKGKKSKAVTVPMHPEMYEYISARLKESLPEAFLFINPTTGKHYCKNTLQDVWSAVRKDAKIDSSLRLYDATRHSFASNLVNSGSTIYKVSKLLGHSSVKMTEKYAHSEVENLRIDMQKLSLRDKGTVRKLSVNEK